MGNVTVTFAYGRYLSGPRDAGRRNTQELVQLFYASYATLLCRSDAMPCYESNAQRATVPDNDNADHPHPHLLYFPHGHSSSVNCGH